MKFPKHWYVFPVAVGGKKAILKQSKEKASKDIEQIKKWATLYPGCNWALQPSRSGLVVVDVDRDGLEVWKKLCRKHGEPQTLKAVTGGRGGYHYVFKADPTVSYKGQLIKGIDVQHNKYILIAPSKVQRGYRWVEKTKALGIIEMPKWLSSICVKPKAAKLKKSNLEFDIEFFKNLGTQLTEKKFNYSTWLNIGMGLHHASDGSEDGFEIYEEITNGVNFMAGDDLEARKKWDSFTSDSDSPVTAGTFLRIAKKLGCTQIEQAKLKPEDFFNDETYDPAPPATGNDSGAVTDSDGKPIAIDPKRWAKHDDGFIFTDKRFEIVKRLNAAGYSMLNGQKAGRIFHTYFLPDGCKEVVELNNLHFKNAVNHIFLREKFIPPAGNPITKMVESDRVWLRSMDKRHYDGICFLPGQQKGMLNLWGNNPIPCKRIKGDVSLVLKFIEKILCNGNPAKASYLLKYLAHIMQKPEEKTRIVPIFIGDEGTGKGLLTHGLLQGILQSRYTLADKPHDVKTNFNKDFAFKFLICLDESCWQGDKELQSILRAKTGNKWITVEEKFGARYMVRDFARFIITANTADAVKIQGSNSRYLIFQNSDKYKDHPIYAQLWDGIENKNLCNKFFDYLMDLDLSTHDPHTFPAELDDDGQDTKIGSDVYRQFLFDLFGETPTALFYNDEYGEYSVRSDMYGAFSSFAARIKSYERNVSSHKFWHELTKIAPVCLAAKAQKWVNSSNLNVLKCGPQDLKDSFYKQMRLGASLEITDVDQYFFK